MYSFKHNQQDATLYNILYCCQCSTCFRLFFRPSSGAQTVHTASGICQAWLLLPLAWVSWHQFYHSVVPSFHLGPNRFDVMKISMFCHIIVQSSDITFGENPFNILVSINTYRRRERFSWAPREDTAEHSVEAGKECFKV